MCCGKEPQSCFLRKKKAKTPQKEKAAVASSSKRKTTSEGASASKRQSILAAWGAETVESSQSSPEEFLEVESSPESHKDGKKIEDFAASFFDQQQCSMVVVDKKGCHHVCTTSPGEHGFLKFTFQGLEHTTEIPNLALESVQATTNLKRPASGAKTVAKAKAVSKKPAAKGKSGAKSMAEPSPADIAPDHQLEEIVSASDIQIGALQGFQNPQICFIGVEERIWRQKTNLEQKHEEHRH